MRFKYPKLQRNSLPSPQDSHPVRKCLIQQESAPEVFDDRHSSVVLSSICDSEGHGTPEGPCASASGGTDEKQSGICGCVNWEEGMACRREDQGPRGN